MTSPAPRLGADVLDELDRRLAPADAELAARNRATPGPGSRSTAGCQTDVVRDGRLLGADMDALRRDLARRARRLWPEGAR